MIKAIPLQSSLGMANPVVVSSNGDTGATLQQPTKGFNSSSSSSYTGRRSTHLAASASGRGVGRGNYMVPSYSAVTVAVCVCKEFKGTRSCSPQYYLMLELGTD